MRQVGANDATVADDADHGILLLLSRNLVHPCDDSCPELVEIEFVVAESASIQVIPTGPAIGIVPESGAVVLPP